jgi:chromosome segregation protein
MYFKSLELIGFKSFAEKTKLNFEPGVTAVVGPNGTGKSNVADAIRWVLGEQSAKSLRASAMQDVIFNGTDTQEPINFAEVSLTFSNEKRILPIDYDEVTITRRIFRSGDTEYLLNKTPVRLKDISELLMGTGIGTESYSIIEQGKMDLVLSSKPEDRRYVFEEASGITKFKSKKKEALRKLEQTEQNLLRINDIILEVKRQISSIERQARKAEKYKIDFEKLKDLEVRQSASEYKALKTQEATSLVEDADSKAREKDLSQEVAEVAGKLAKYRQVLDEANRKISELRRCCSEMSNSFDMNSHKIEIDRERITETESIQEGLKKEIESAKEKIRDTKVVVEKLKEELANVASQRSAKEKALKENELLLADLAKFIEETELKARTFKVEIVDYLSKETRIKNELIKLGADIQNRNARHRRLALEREAVGKELKSSGDLLDAVSKEFRDAEERLSGIEVELAARKNVYEKGLSELKGIEERIAEEDKNLYAVKSKAELLEENIKSHEGYRQAVQALIRKPNPVSGVRGVLAGLLKVQRGYEDAVNLFLASDAQLVVMEDDAGVRRAIEYLKKANLGRVRFVSLETLKRLQVQGRQTPPARISLAPLDNFVKAASGCGAVVEHFFKAAYLADSLEDGISKIGPAGAVIVTKSGEMYDNGRIIGGGVQDSENSMLIGREERLSDLKNELKKLEESLASRGRARADKTSEAKAAELAVDDLEAQHLKGEVALANIKAKRDAQKEIVDKFKDELGLLESELEETAGAISDLTKRGEEMNAELNIIEAEKSSKQNFIDESQSCISEKRAAGQRAGLEIATLKSETASLQKEEASTHSNLKGREALLFEFEDTLYSKENDLKESTEKIKSLKEEIENLSAENGKQKTELAALNEEAAGHEASRAGLAGELTTDELQVREKEKALESLRDQIRDIEVKLTEVNYKKTNLKDRILQAYKVDLELTHAESENGVDWDTIKTQVAELKDRLEKMGPVNLVAIEEHKELEERCAFLVHQQDDLVRAKDDLHKAIQKINKTTKELFIDAFTKIQVEFKNFFRMLFGGGQAELVLIDEQDILESGIEIIVRPPGKKFQNLMLLSGGEKALTAIALLFAIFKVKPSPFCVLDEIDAPLDESNINRFSNVLKDFLKISQFIIITHNKRTIELADVMYGITMQERGVSKIVSVKFLDEKKKAEVAVADV